MTELRSQERSSGPVPAADKSSYIVPLTTNGYGDYDSGEAETFIKTLDEKRRELDHQISLYIAERQKEYETYERQLRERLGQSKEGGTSGDDSKALEDSTESQSSQGVANTMEPPEGGSKLSDFTPLKLEDKFVTGKENTADAVPKDGPARRTFAQEREELMGLFTPTFLPLLEGMKVGSQGHNRSNTAPPDALKRAAEKPAVPVAQRMEVRRSSTEPTFPVKHTRKSSLRPASATKSPQQRPKPRKHVTLDIGDAIVDPATDISGSEPEPTLSPTHHSLKSPQPEEPPKIEQSAPSIQHSAPQSQQPVTSTQQSASQPQKPSTNPNSGPPAHNEAMFSPDPAASASPPRPLDGPTSTRSGPLPPLEPYSRPSPAQASAGASAPRGAEVSNFFRPPDEAVDDDEIARPGLERQGTSDDMMGSFVGGIDGDSGFDPADAGSVGYPGTSLGASYMEAHHSWRQSTMREAEQQRRDRGRGKEPAMEPESPQSGRSAGFDVLMKGGNDDDDEFLGGMEDL